MINLNNYYIHSVVGPKRYALKKFESILSSGYIKSRNEQQTLPSEAGYHTIDDICLTDPTQTEKEHTYSAFDLYVCNSISLMLSRNITVFKPDVRRERDISLYQRKTGLYTNIYDEVRARESIGIDEIKGIIVPVSYILANDYDYLLFNDTIFNLLVNCDVSSFTLSLYSSYKRKEMRDRIKIKEMNRVINKIQKLLEEYNLDIDIYDYDEDKKVKRLKL